MYNSHTEFFFSNTGTGLIPVSYTHLDVYKRQVVRCGGYKEEPENLAFSGNPHENPVEFLKLFEAYVTRENPLMDDEDVYKRQA